jgi:hypothetical protein
MLVFWMGLFVGFNSLLYGELLTTRGTLDVRTSRDKITLGGMAGMRLEVSIMTLLRGKLLTTRGTLDDGTLSDSLVIRMCFVMAL